MSRSRRALAFVVLVASSGCGANVVFDPNGEGGEGGESDRWCAQNRDAFFCADFDGEDLFEEWDTAAAPGAQAVASDRSAPNALLITEPPVAPGGQPPRSELIETAELDGRDRGRVAFDLRIDELGADDDRAAMNVVRLALVRRTTSSTLYHFQAGLWVARASTRLKLVVACGYANSEPPPPCVDHEPGSDDQEIELTDVPRGRWVRVEVTLEIGAVSSRAAIAYDGAPAGELTTVAADPATVDSVEVAMGSVNAQYEHSGAFQASFDNVVLD